MSVVAHWPDVDNRANAESIRATMNEVLVHSNPIASADEVFPGHYAACYEDGGDLERMGETTESVYLAAVVTIGVTEKCWWDRAKGAYWVATRDDLTAEGRALLVILDAALGVPAVLITTLST
jgi:hypothetical protein